VKEGEGNSLSPALLAPALLRSCAPLRPAPGAILLRKKPQVSVGVCYFEEMRHIFLTRHPGPCSPLGRRWAFLLARTTEPRVRKLRERGAWVVFLNIKRISKESVIKHAHNPPTYQWPHSVHRRAACK